MSRPKKDSGVEWLGMMPAHWEVKKLKQVATLRTGRTPPGGAADHIDEEGIPWITPDQLSPEIGIVGKPINIKMHQGTAIGISKAGSLLLCCIGSIGKFGYARHDVCTNQQINSATFGNSTVPNFARFLGDLIGLQLVASANKVTLPICNKWQTGEVYIPYPPPPEQRAIADFLDAETERIDALVEKKQRLVDLLTERRQAIITQAVTKGLDHDVAMKDSGIEWLGEIPAHWEVKRLKHCVDSFISGGTPDTKTLEYWTYGDDGIPWVAISDMTSDPMVRETEKHITELGRKSKKLTLIEKGTLLYSMYASLGKVAILDISATVNQAILGIEFKSKVADRDYVRRWLEHLKPNIELLSSGNTQENLNAEKVRNIPVFFPSLPEQRAIADYLDAETARIDALVTNLQRQIELLTERRQAVIIAAVTGKLDVSAAIGQRIGSQ